MRIDSLTPFRFFSCVVVIIFHFGEVLPGWSYFERVAFQMLSFFFVLSGFVLTISHNQKSTPFKPFMKARAVRIYPCFIIALILTLFAQLTDGRNVDVGHIPIIGALVLLHLLLLHAWTPLSQTLNFPSWSLSVEMALYFCFPFIKKTIERYNPKPKHFMFFACVFWFITQLILSFSITQVQTYRGFITGMVNYFPLSHLCSFILGIAVAYLYISLSNKHLEYWRKVSLPAMMFFVPIAACIIIKNDWIEGLINYPIASESSASSILFSFFIFLMAVDRSWLTKCLSIKPLLLLGEASYGMYLFQYPLHKIWEEKIVNHFSISAEVNFIAYFIILIVFSILVYLYVEKPIMRAYKKRLTAG